LIRKVAIQAVVSTPTSRRTLIAYLDQLANGAGDPNIWPRITTAFRLRDDPGACFALAYALATAMEMADSLGFGGLAFLAKAWPLIQAISAALREIPEPARLKLANPQFGTHHCSGSPAEFPLLCCFTTEISDQAILSRIVALRSFVLLGVLSEIDRSAQLKVVTDGLRKAQTLPHPWADLIRNFPASCWVVMYSSCIDTSMYSLAVCLVARHIDSIASRPSVKSSVRQRCSYLDAARVPSLESAGVNAQSRQMERIQLNLRIDKELEQAIDGKRIELQKKLGYIPTRSDIARLALDEYLGRSRKAKRASGSSKGS